MLKFKEIYCLKYWPLAADVGLRYGINPATILAVGAQEGDFGRSKNARVRNNHFGLGPHNVYPTDTACFEAFGKLMASRNYEACALVSGNINAYVQRMSRTKYVDMPPPAKALWARNVVRYFQDFQTLAAAHNLRPGTPVLAQTSTIVTRG